MKRSTRWWRALALRHLFPQSRRSRRRTHGYWHTLAQRLFPRSRRKRLNAVVGYVFAALVKQSFPSPQRAASRRVRNHRFQVLDVRTMLDGTPWISINSQTAYAPQSLVFTINYGNMPYGTTISYSTQGGHPGSDYTATSGSFGGGSGYTTVTVSTINNGSGQTDTMQLSASGDGASGTGYGTIIESGGRGVKILRRREKRWEISS